MSLGNGAMSEEALSFRVVVREALPREVEACAGRAGPGGATGGSAIFVPLVGPVPVSS